jgi:hypothetical protein
MDEGPSLGELGRLIQLLRSDIRDDMAQINGRLDRMVSTDVYGVEKAGLERDIAEVKRELANVQAQRLQDVERVTQTRRWMFASVVIPILGLVLPLVLFLAGGKS